jgi:RimJ/RimL family protein N-acetyltransferase
VNITLRFPEHHDIEPLFDAVRESIPELHPWAPWCPLTYSLSDAAHWVERQPAAREAGTAFEFLVLDDQGRILGCCGINQVNSGFRLGNLGYWIRTSATLRGCATEAALMAAAWAFANTDLHRLELLVAVENRASQAVALKAGASLEGRLRCRFLVHGRFQDAFVYSIIRPSPQPPSNSGISSTLPRSAV